MLVGKIILSKVYVKPQKGRDQTKSESKEKKEKKYIHQVHSQQNKDDWSAWSCIMKIQTKNSVIRVKYADVTNINNIDFVRSVVMNTLKICKNLPYKD